MRRRGANSFLSSKRQIQFISPIFFFSSTSFPFPNNFCHSTKSRLQFFVRNLNLFPDLLVLFLRKKNYSLRTIWKSNSIHFFARNLFLQFACISFVMKSKAFISFKGIRFIQRRTALQFAMLWKCKIVLPSGYHTQFIKVFAEYSKNMHSLRITNLFCIFFRCNKYSYSTHRMLHIF